MEDKNKKLQFCFFFLDHIKVSQQEKNSKAQLHFIGLDFGVITNETNIWLATFSHSEN